MRYEFHPEALEEYQVAAAYYASCQSPLAMRSIESIESAIQRVVATPNRWHRLEDDLRQFLVPDFPYVIIYSVETDSILILSVMHSHREPGYWRNRV